MTSLIESTKTIPAMSDAFKHGRLITKVLTHSWRASPSALEISTEELDIVAPMLLESRPAQYLFDGSVLLTYSFAQCSDPLSIFIHSLARQ